MLRWAVLVPSSHRPVILNQTHHDWPWPLHWIRRSWTAFIGGTPRKLLGNAPKRHCAHTGFGVDQWGAPLKFCPAFQVPIRECPTAFPLPIPDRGQWWLGWPLFITLQLANRVHARLGFRYDEDGYYTITVQPYKRMPEREVPS